jgi:peptide-methionine (S)-S-oxide reductase
VANEQQTATPDHGASGLTENETVATDVATLGGGCFWCLDAVYRSLRGVHQVISGYEGGAVVNPTYRDVCGGMTGHAEVVQVHFDPKVIDYADILNVFFAIHDPTTPDRQGHDIGPQYRSVIFAHGPDQHRIALQVINDMKEQRIYPVPIVTQVHPATTFYPAEDYHQDYFSKNPDAGYCRAVVGPKVGKFRKSFADRLKG